MKNQRITRRSHAWLFVLLFALVAAGIHGAIPAQAKVVGDINGDGVIDLADVALMAAAIMSPVYVPAADLNADGIVNLVDVSILAQCL